VDSMVGVDVGGLAALADRDHPPLLEGAIVGQRVLVLFISQLVRGALWSCASASTRADRPIARPIRPMAMGSRVLTGW
jgi:hypothetical protein